MGIGRRSITGAWLRPPPGAADDGLKALPPGRLAVVVSLKDANAARETVRWALGSVAQPADAVTLLVIVSRVPTDGVGTQVKVSEARRMVLSGHLLHEVQPYMQMLKGVCWHFKVVAETRIGLHDVEHMGIAGEVELMGATKLVMGRSGSVFWRPRALLGNVLDQIKWGLGPKVHYCIKNRPSACAVYVVQRGRLLFTEAAAKPHQPPPAELNPGGTGRSSAPSLLSPPSSAESGSSLSSSSSWSRSSSSGHPGLEERRPHRLSLQLGHGGERSALRRWSLDARPSPPHCGPALAATPPLPPGDHGSADLAMTPLTETPPADYLLSPSAQQSRRKSLQARQWDCVDPEDELQDSAMWTTLRQSINMRVNIDVSLRKSLDIPMSRPRRSIDNRF